MNIVQSGSRLQVYGEDVQTFKEIPVGSYDVCFNKMTGFYLSTRNDLEANEDKIYGNHLEKVHKVLTSFGLSQRNFGVMLSGQKGIGKSLFARILAEESIKVGLPVITVTIAIPGIADFLASIEQEVVVIFDEFEKVFACGDDYDPQTELLSLFDGTDGGKKLFVITCNEVKKLSDFLVNRPGRFHYHFTIKNPTPDEVKEYMIDKLNPQYYDVIDKVISLAQAINITYDYLRAIAFEINQGYSIEETLNDLNIVKTDSICFDAYFTFSNGLIYTAFSKELDLFNHEEVSWRLYGTPSGRGNRDGAFSPAVTIWFKPSDIEMKNGRLILSPENAAFRFDTDYYDDDDEKIKAQLDKFRNATIEKVVFQKIDTSLDRFTV